MWKCRRTDTLPGIRQKESAVVTTASSKGMPVTEEQKALCEIAKSVYHIYPSDGKYIIDEARLILCQSNAPAAELRKRYPAAEVNPLGDWTGGTDVDSGATNRKLGSDMADSVTGGGLHGKDLSKADVSVNIYAWLKAQETGKPWNCAAPSGTIQWTVFPTLRSWRLPGDTSRALAVLRNLRNGGWCDEDNDRRCSLCRLPSWYPM